jgi:hypothetical protein
LFFPGLYAISKSKAPKAANHLCPVASKFAVVNTYVSIQQNDSEIGPWIKYVKTGIKPKKGILPTSLPY